jgi:hypothetical protein
MHHLRSLGFLAVVLLPSAGTAQNWVPNGDFSNGLTGWTESGYSFIPQVETFDTSGLGADPCYACGPGGQVTPSPYPPNSIEQSVVLAPVAYEFTADISVSGLPTTVNNADAGTFWVEVNGVEIARTALGGYTQQRVQRARLAARFVPNLAGPQLLRIYFHRRFLGTANTPRSYLDNVSLQIAQGPTFALRGNRKLSSSLTLDLLGEPNSTLLFFLSGNRIPGIPIPGVNGHWTLDPARVFVLVSGATNPTGVLSLPVTLPGDPALLTSVLYVQGLQVSSTLQLDLGFDQFLTFVQ